MSESPLAELRTVSRPLLAALTLLGVAKGLALVGLASALALVLTGHPDALALGIASALARALLAWAQRVVSSRALLGSKERLRARLADRALAAPVESPGALATLATDGLDELDKYYTVYLPALVTAATVPVVVGIRILSADWVSALVLVLTVPLIPVFMALIGLHTRDRVAEATTALGRLSDHLVELARGLPVLAGLGRAEDQVAALREVSERHRRVTMGTLRTAFLSSLALELIATISVAIVAVFIGVRLVSGDLSLEVGLLVLVLAPEVMAPFREIGVAFHAAQSGREALSRAEEAIDAPVDAVQVVDGTVGVAHLGIRFASRAAETVHDLSFDVAPGSVTLIDGRSGSGKSTVLAAIAGRLPQGATVEGVVTGVDRARLAWLPQHPRFAAETFSEELEVYGASAGRSLELLDALGLSDLETATASPGEQRRLAVARVIARVEAGADLVVLDEPTAQLDARAADRVIALLEPLRGRVTIVVASHDSRVRALADSVVSLGASAAGTTTVSGGEGERRDIRRPVAREGRPGRALRDFLRPVRGRMLGTIVLGALATLFAVALTGLSGWLIVRASEHPPIMYLLVAIVGVRFFGIGRAVLRYGERLVGHDTAFRATTGLRMRLWMSLARATDRRLLTAGASLDRLVRDADRVRDLVLRTVVPIVAGYLALGAFGVVAVAIEGSPAPLWFVLAAGLVAPIVALWGDRLATRGSEELRSTALRRFAAMLVAADDLRGNGVDGGVRSELAAIDRRAGVSARRSSSALGLGSAVVIAACGITAVLLGASGGVQAGLGAMLALSALALAEPLTDAVAAIQLVPALRHSLAAVDLEPDTRAAPRTAPGRIHSLDLHGLSAGWNGQAVVADATAHASRGDLLAITGPSGSGKSTIASVILGQAAPMGGSYRLDGVDAGDLDLRGRIGWCPQEGHLFDSTLRANLLIARERGDAPSERELREALQLVGLGGLLAGLPDGLDTRVGREGSRLSGGERQRVAVARAILTGCDVIVIDEPTAQLDEETAEALMRDLRIALADRIGVLVTHHPYGLRESDPRLRLGAHAMAAA